MTMVDMHSFISSINGYVRSEDGVRLAKSLQLPLGRKTIPKIYKQLAQRAQSINAVSYCESNISDSNIAVAVGNMIKALVALCDGKWTESYNFELLSYNAILAYFRDEPSNWIIPVLVLISNDLRMLAVQADTAMKKRDNETLRDALRNLTNGFNAVAKDRTPFTDPNSKKLAIFSVTNVLFKIYFKLNTLQLCSKLINVVERPGPANALDSYHLFPVADVVTYKFYIGRLKMFEDKYEDARECFMFALRHTPQSEVRNRRRILCSLVPVQMCLGVMPGPAVGTVYGFTDYMDLGRAVIAGNLKSYDEIMQRNQRTFICSGVYLVLEQVKMIAYRNLLKKLYMISNSTRIKLGWMESAMQWMGDEEIDLDEIECIIANLIYQGKVKGYISHQKRTLIISKQDPFPKAAIIKSTV